MSKNKILSGAAIAYVTFFRGTPLLCQLYLCYYGAGEIRPFLTDIGLWWFFREAFFCCTSSPSRSTRPPIRRRSCGGALAAVPKGQIERGGSLGLSKYRISRHVVLAAGIPGCAAPVRQRADRHGSKASALAAIVTLLAISSVRRASSSRGPSIS